MGPKEIMAKASRAHKELLRYQLEHQLEPEDIRGDHPVHGQHIQRLLDIIKAGKQSSFLHRTLQLEDKYKVNKNQYYKDGSKSKKRRLRILEEKKRADLVARYPPHISESQRKHFRDMYKVHINSGMSKEMAYKLTCDTLGYSTNL